MACLAVALLAFVAKSGTPMHYYDERQYFDIALNVEEGRGFVIEGVPTAYRPPAWPLALAGALYLGLPPQMLSLVSAASLICAALCAAAIAVTLTGSHWGFLAGIAMLVYPLNVYTAATLYPQAFATLLVTALWLTALLSRQSERGKHVVWLAIAGLLAALLSLTAPTMAFTGVAVAGWIVFAARGRRLVAAAVVALFFIAPMAAWSARNTVVLGSPVLLSTSSGENLAIGNNPSATGESGVNVDIGSWKRSTAGMSELEADRALRGQALNWVASNPAAATKLYLEKVANYFSPYNKPVTAARDSIVQRVVAYASFVLLAFLVALRLFLRKRFPLDGTERLFIWIYLLNSLVMAVFFTRTRFRQPLDSILLIEAAIGISFLIGLEVQRRRRSLGAGDGTT